jgi:DNA-binding transcriptional regulator LsrR (DeoR family)
VISDADPDVSLATRAAWLSYIGGLTQSQIADRMRLSRIKVNRLIAYAHELDLITVFIAGEPAECIALEDGLTRRFGLSLCTVVPTYADAGDAKPTISHFAALGVAGARFLHQYLERSGPAVIGVSHGRTLAAVADRVPHLPRADLRFVSLLGSLTRKAAANPFDVVHRLADRTGGEGYFMPVPFVADSIQDKKVMLSQKSLSDIFALARRCDLFLVGVGELGPLAHMRATGMVTEVEYKDLKAHGAVGDVIGQFLGADGRPVASEVNQRTLGLRIEDLRGREVVAVAGGGEKRDAILATLASGIVTGLIIDEATARLVLAAADRPAARPPRGNARQRPSQATG